MEIKRIGTVRSGKSPTDYFAGTVRVDMLFDAPGEKHWHGAAPTTAMNHIAIQEELAGKTVDWMEQLSDEQYQA